MNRVNYDEVSLTYDQRYHPGALEGILNSLKSNAASVNASSILEVGCGTGHWLAQMTEITNRFGLDYSRGMLTRAACKDRSLHLIQGTAQQLPFPNESIDFVYCVHALHFFDNPSSFFAEARRILRPGAALAVIAMDPHSGLDQWYLYDYFPGTYEKDLARYPAGATVTHWMEQAGFTSIQTSTADTIEHLYLGSQVYTDPTLQKNGTSQLALLSMDEFEQGMERINQQIQSAEDNGLTAQFYKRIHLTLWLGCVH
jgi:ubiquinone/menaquinone biosynthesis C-methylase UbiE